MLSSPSNHRVVNTLIDEITIFVNLYVVSQIVDVFWNVYQTLSPCQNCQLKSQQRLAGIIKIPKTVRKRHPVAITVRHRHERHHWSIGLPGFIFESEIQDREISPSSGGSEMQYLCCIICPSYSADNLSPRRASSHSCQIC